MIRQIINTVLFTLILFHFDAASAQHSEWSLQKGVIFFASGSSKLDSTDKKYLVYLKNQMDANPGFKVVIEGSICHSKKEELLNWKRVNAIIEYMTTQSIDRTRFIFKYKGSAPADMVIYRTPIPGEEGPSTVPPPLH